MSYWTKFIIAIHSDDAHVKKDIESLCGSVQMIEIDCLSTIYYIDTKDSILEKLLWMLRNLNFKYPESVQVFFQGESDFKYRTIDIFPENQEIIDNEEGLSPKKNPLYFNGDFVKAIKPSNWDNPSCTCKPSKNGWVKCPGCGIKFKAYDKYVFINNRHHCGQKIIIDEQSFIE